MQDLYDAEGNLTHWDYDIGGRLLCKTCAAGTNITKPMTLPAENRRYLAGVEPVISARRRKKPTLRGELIVQLTGTLWKPSS